MSENAEVLTAEKTDDNELLVEQAYEALAGGPAKASNGIVNNQSPTKWQKWKENFKRKGWILVFILPALIYVLIFCYGPMYGILVAFQDYLPGNDIIGKDTLWVGFDNFKTFFSDPNFGNYFLNTFLLCILGFIVGFPLPIIVALLLNSVKPKKVKKGLQILYYAPHFISLVVLVGMLKLIFGSDGLLDQLSIKMGGDANGLQLFLKAEAFRPLFIFSGNWQDFGWSAIIYLAALSGVDPALHEAAKVDGASRFRRIFSVDLPAILPTIVMLMILSVGNLMSCGYEKVLLMQTDGNISTSEIISTYVYGGLMSGQYGLSTASGLFNSVINVVLLVIANFTSKKLANQSMW
ncbi:MAG: ABC transporter permease subunit [Clostridia bacterium]|nr:ABC transporter permease subunit [Clostridia bacterium]